MISRGSSCCRGSRRSSNRRQRIQSPHRQRTPGGADVVGGSDETARSRSASSAHRSSNRGAVGDTRNHWSCARGAGEVLVTVRQQLRSDAGHPRMSSPGASVTAAAVSSTAGARITAGTIRRVRRSPSTTRRSMPVVTPVAPSSSRGLTPGHPPTSPAPSTAHRSLVPAAMTTSVWPARGCLPDRRGHRREVTRRCVVGGAARRRQRRLGMPCSGRVGQRVDRDF